MTQPDTGGGTPHHIVASAGGDHLRFVTLLNWMSPFVRLDHMFFKQRRKFRQFRSRSKADAKTRSEKNSDLSMGVHRRGNDQSLGDTPQGIPSTRVVVVLTVCHDDLASRRLSSPFNLPVVANSREGVFSGLLAY